MFKHCKSVQVFLKIQTDMQHNQAMIIWIDQIQIATYPVSLDHFLVCFVALSRCFEMINNSENDFH